MGIKSFFVLTDTYIAPMPDGASLETSRRIFGPTAHINADGKFQCSHIVAISTNPERVADTLDFSDRQRLGKLTPEEQAMWDETKAKFPPLSVDYDDDGIEPEFIMSVEEFKDFAPIRELLLKSGINGLFIDNIEKDVMDYGLSLIMKYELLSFLIGNKSSDDDAGGDYYGGC